MIYERETITPLEVEFINIRINDPDFPYTADTMVYTAEEAELSKEFARQTCRPHDLRWFRGLVITLRKNEDRLLKKKTPGRLPALPKLLSRYKSYLVKLYVKQSIVLDKLPHTKEFEVIAAEFNKKFNLSWSNNEIYRHFLNIRKSGDLPRKSQPKKKPKPMPLLDSKPSPKPKPRRPSNPEANPD